MTKSSTSLWRVSLTVSPQCVFFQAATGKIFGRTCNEVQMLQCIIVQSEKTYTLACVVAAAVRSAACRQQSRGAHRCMCPVFPDGNDAGRKATREVTAISATQAHPAAARHQMGWRATGQHPPGQLAAMCLSIYRPIYVSIYLSISLWSCKIFKMVTASATVRCLRRASHMSGLSARSCRRLLAIYLAADRFYLGISASTQGCDHARDTRRCSMIHRSICIDRWLQATAMFDMASRRCGQKRHTGPTGATGRLQESYRRWEG